MNGSTASTTHCICQFFLKVGANGLSRLNQLDLTSTNVHRVCVNVSFLLSFVIVFSTRVVIIVMWWKCQVKAPVRADSRSPEGRKPQSEAAPGSRLLSPPPARWPGAAGTTDWPGGRATTGPARSNTRCQQTALQPPQEVTFVNTQERRRHLLDREAHGQSHQVRDLLSRHGPVSFLEGHELWSLEHRQAVAMDACRRHDREAKQRHSSNTRKIRLRVKNRNAMNYWGSLPFNLSFSVLDFFILVSPLSVTRRHHVSF